MLYDTMRSLLIINYQLSIDLTLTSRVLIDRLRKGQEVRRKSQAPPRVDGEGLYATIRFHATGNEKRLRLSWRGPLSPRTTADVRNHNVIISRKTRSIRFEAPFQRACAARRSSMVTSFRTIRITPESQIQRGKLAGSDVDH